MWLAALGEQTSSFIGYPTFSKSKTLTRVRSSFDCPDRIRKARSTPPLVEVGEGARKTNKDYTQGALAELIDIIIAEKAALSRLCCTCITPLKTLRTSIKRPRVRQKLLKTPVDTLRIT